MPRALLRPHVALPQQHGSWALWLGPYAVGALAGGAMRPGLFWLTLAVLGAFLALQPLTLLVKVWSNRRPAADRRPALVWIGTWGLLAGIGAWGLAASGHRRVLWLGLAALPVLAWQLALVARRAERGQVGVELVEAGVLTLAAPAAYEVTGAAGTTGWWLWGLCWLQAAGAILYVHLRLRHRRMTRVPDWPARLSLAWLAIAYHVAALGVVGLLAGVGLVPRLALLPFAAMLAETLHGGVLRPAVGTRPSRIGIRQVLVTLVFAALLILAYRLGRG